MKGRENGTLDFLIDGFLPFSYLTVIGADSKAGKSCLVTSIANAVCNGTDFAGLKATQAPVLWVACEESEQERALILAQYPSVSENLYLTHDPILVDSPEGIENLRYWVHQTGAKLVVIDPLYGAVQTELNTPKAGRDAMKGLKHLCRTENIAVIVLHHINKNIGVGMVRARFSDSGQILATSSIDWLMDTRILKDGSREITLKIAGRLAGAIEPVRVFLSTSPTHYELIKGGTNHDYRQEHRDEEILRVLRASESGMTAGDIAEALGFQVKSIQNRITLMLKRGALGVIGTRGKASVYGCDRELIKD
jgi:DNA-binding NarL/FixJ family response regulator